MPHNTNVSNQLDTVIFIAIQNKDESKIEVTLINKDQYLVEHAETEITKYNNSLNGLNLYIFL
jgi:hypothetical protein